MTEPAKTGMPTPLPVVSGLTLAELRELDLSEEIAVVLKQVERPRVNLGGNGPPGRAD